MSSQAGNLCHLVSYLSPGDVGVLYWLYRRNILSNHDDLQSDGEDADDDGCFVPSKLDLENSSEEEEETKMDSEDELVVKRSRRSAGPRTPSTEKTRASARTPRETPNRKVQQDKAVKCSRVTKYF